MGDVVCDRKKSLSELARLTDVVQKSVALGTHVFARKDS